MPRILSFTQPRHRAQSHPRLADSRSYNRRAMPASIALLLTLSTALFVASKGNRVLVTLTAVDAGASPLQLGILFALQLMGLMWLVMSRGRPMARETLAAAD